MVKFQFAGLAISIAPSAWLMMAVSWLGLTLVGVMLLQFSVLESILGGLIAVLMYWTGDLWHHLGHSWAARRTGYPMLGVHFWGVLGTSLYPTDEPALAGSVHIRRALGGPLFSFIVGLSATIAALLMPPSVTLPYVLLGWFAFVHLGLLTVGAFFPLGFNDGSTILRHWGR